MVSAIVLTRQTWQETQLISLFFLSSFRESLSISGTVSGTPGRHWSFSFPTAASGSHARRPLHSHSLTTLVLPPVPSKVNQMTVSFPPAIIQPPNLVASSVQRKLSQWFWHEFKRKLFTWIGPVRSDTRKNLIRQGTGRRCWAAFSLVMYSVSQCIPMYPTFKHILVFCNIVHVSTSSPDFP